MFSFDVIHKCYPENRIQPHSKRVMQTGLLFFLSCVLSMGFFPQSSAAFERGCHGIVYAQILSGEYLKTGEPILPMPKEKNWIELNEKLVLVDGRGKCSGQAKANSECRPKARDAAMKCGEALIRQFNNPQFIESKCGPSSNATIREWAPYLTRADIDWAPFEAWNNLGSLIQFQTCCSRGGDTAIKFATLQLGFQSNSVHNLKASPILAPNKNDRAQAACWKNEIINPNFFVDCRQVRQMGLCGDLNKPRDPWPTSKPPSPTTPKSSSKPPSPTTGKLDKDTTPLAKTSATTSASSATQQQIADALDKKKQKKIQDAQKGEPIRTNPVNYTEEISTMLNYRAVVNQGKRTQMVTEPARLADFYELGASMSKNANMRLVDFEMVLHKGIHYVGLWEPGAGTSIFKESLPVVAFNKLHKQNKESGLRLADFELVQKKGELQVVSLWVPGQRDEVFSPSMSQKAFKERNAVMKERNMYPVDIEVHLEDNKIRFAALWRQPTTAGLVAMAAGGAQFMPLLPIKDLKNYRDQLVAKGKRIIDLEIVEKDNKRFATALWVNGKGPSGISKPRKHQQFTTFLLKNNNLIVEDLEVHKPFKQ